MVRRIMSSCSSLESSSKSEKGGMDGGYWDPMYDGFALDERGAPSHYKPTRGAQNLRPPEQERLRGPGRNT